MTGKGTLTQNPQRRFRLVLMAQAIWLLIVVLLGAWWIRLLLRQAERISELETLLGLSGPAIAQWHKTQRMLFWESGTFFALILLSSLALSWLYYREIKRSKSIQAFFASLTHELKTPLTSIRLQAESLEDLLKSNPDSQNYITRLLEDTLRLESQVERTLELARVEGGGPLYPRPLVIKSWLERFLRTSLESYTQKAEVTVEGDSSLQVQADISALQVILRNIIENSVKHSKTPTLEISIQIDDVSQFETKITIRNNGEAFKGDPKLLGGLFQKGPQSQGTGVGLYLSRALMEGMGGRLEILTEDSSGFVIELIFQKSVDHG